MSTSTLPKPFKPKKVTNSNVNEEITNFMLKIICTLTKRYFKYDV